LAFEKGKRAALRDVSFFLRFPFSPHLGKPVKSIQELLFGGKKTKTLYMLALSGSLEAFPRQVSLGSRSFPLPNRGGSV